MNSLNNNNKRPSTPPRQVNGVVAYLEQEVVYHNAKQRMQQPRDFYLDPLEPGEIVDENEFSPTPSSC